MRTRWLNLIIAVSLILIWLIASWIVDVSRAQKPEEILDNKISGNVYFVPPEWEPSFPDNEYIAPPSQSATTKLYFTILPSDNR
jgi:hypothetical protein